MRKPKHVSLRTLKPRVKEKTLPSDTGLMLKKLLLKVRSCSPQRRRTGIEQLILAVDLQTLFFVAIILSWFGKIPKRLAVRVLLVMTRQDNNNLSPVVIGLQEMWFRTGNSNAHFQPANVEQLEDSINETKKLKAVKGRINILAHLTQILFFQKKLSA